MPSTKLNRPTLTDTIGPPRMPGKCNGCHYFSPTEYQPVDNKGLDPASNRTAMDKVIDKSPVHQKLAQLVLIIGDISKELDSSYQAPEKCHRTVTTPSHLNTDISDKDKELEKKVFLLESENKKVREQLRDVIAMNTRWQLYDAQRDDYVVQLNLKLNSLQKQLDELSARSKTVDDVDHVADSKEKIQALEYQVKTSQEDFELERMDRARVQGQLQQLKEKFEEAERANKQQKDLIFFYQEQLGELRRGFDEPDVRANYRRNVNRPKYHNYLRRGGLSDDVEVDNVNDFDLVESSGNRIEIPVPFVDVSDDFEVDGDTSKEETDGSPIELLCPKCSKHFLYSEHDKLVEHMDHC